MHNPEWIKKRPTKPGEYWFRTTLNTAARVIRVWKYKNDRRAEPVLFTNEDCGRPLNNAVYDGWWASCPEREPPPVELPDPTLEERYADEILELAQTHIAERGLGADAAYLKKQIAEKLFDYYQEVSAPDESDE